jgi:hypothetical protein
MKNIKLLPKNKLGEWSVVLIMVMMLFFYLGMSFVDFYSSIPAGRTIPQDIINRPGVALLMLAGFASGIIAFITGLVAIIKNRERSVLVFVSTIIGALLILYLAGEIIFPGEKGS